ncbi:MAG TPA: copper chaperone PCu(A)C [Rhodocyclaceae bacterium]|nr:copper chaperone PCu(A)C [Rhodocyclaceae bacterium]
MNNVLRALLATCAFSVALPALATDLEVKTPWVRSTVQGQPATGAFMELSSKDGVTVIGASSSVAGTVQVHQMKMDNGVMKMNALRQLEVPAGGNVSLAPGGYHVMLMDLKQQLKPGDTVPLTLKVKGKNGKQENVDVKAEVRDMTASTTKMGDDHSQMHDAMHQHMHEHMYGDSK